MYIADPEIEKKEILKRYRNLLRVWSSNKDVKDKRKVRQAFNLAVDAHKDMRRRSGEPYIYHPIEVARICAGEIGLGETSIICALIHDVVEDTEYPLESVRQEFGDTVARIVDGLTKIKGIFDNVDSSQQAENYKKMLLTLSDDLRVILIKLADRLHNMRTLDAMPPIKQLKIASETIYLFAPLAHRMGLYAIKSELEDLAMKYTEPEMYASISSKLHETEIARVRFVNKFIYPIKRALAGEGIKFEIISREKSIFSIWKKMKTKEIPFEEVYDIFAIRIILDTPVETEKYDCWKVYSIVTDFYNPKQNRLRDWISTPKANGYESLHTTVMSHTGQWVEVQIRTRRMHDISERGLAAHYKYKQKDKENEKTGKEKDKDRLGSESGLDDWLTKIKEVLQSTDADALTFLDNFKLNLFADELIVFTPKGDLKKLPLQSTILDFAYNIHSELGNRCIGAKVNHKLVPLGYILKTGDQVEIITSKKQQPKAEWLDMVISARARNYISNTLKDSRKKAIDEGKVKLESIFTELSLEMSKGNLLRFSEHMGLPNLSDLFTKVAIGEIGSKEVKECCAQSVRTAWFGKILQPFSRSREKSNLQAGPTLGERAGNLKGEIANPADFDEADIEIAQCCQPMPGDDIVGYVNGDRKIQLHRTNCSEAILLMSRHADRIIRSNWSNRESNFYLTGIRITGIDQPGLIHDITTIITEKFKLNIRSFHLDSTGDIYEAEVFVYVRDTMDLGLLIDQLKRLKNIDKVYRIKYSGNGNRNK
jgi:GTP diphosphokinase / guanosine-3',5'-bis(diphosphate) 3'-diphosphatase